MKKILRSLLLFPVLSIGQCYGEQDVQLQTTETLVNHIDLKNVLAQVKNRVIIRSFQAGYSGVNSRKCYLEAYDIQTGDLVWSHEDVGMITSFILVNDEKIIYRNYHHLTAIDVSNGTVIWSKQTKGEYSTLEGE